MLHIAEQQHGAVSVIELRACGLNAQDQRFAGPAVSPSLSRRCWWSRVCDTWHQRLQIGLLALGDVGSATRPLPHCSGSTDRSLEHCSTRCLDLCAAHRRPVARFIRPPELAPADVLTVCGFRCASATRTILDLAAAAPRQVRLAAGLDSAMRLRLSAPLVLVERLSQLHGPGRHGVRVLDQLMLDSGGETMLERRFLALIRKANLLRPATQHRVRCHVTCHVDFLTPQRRRQHRRTRPLSTPASYRLCRRAGPDRVSSFDIAELVHRGTVTAMVDCPAAPARRSEGTHRAHAQRPAQRRHRRPRRPRQDDARRPDAVAVRGVPRQPGRRRAGHGLDGPRAGEGHHDPRQEHGDPLRRRGRAR